MISLDNALWIATPLIETVVLGLIIYRRLWRLLPIFTIYCIWDICADIAYVPIQRFAHDSYLTFYLVETFIDSVLQFCVLVELAWSVLRPIRSSLPRSALVVVSGLILAVGMAIWPFSDVHAALSPEGHLLMHLLQTVSIMRIVFFLALAGCSQLLSIGWRDRELQVATGLGFYSIVNLGVAMLHTHSATSAQNSEWNQFVVGSYICSLLYWSISFAQQEAKRREFTPQMQNLLLAMAGVARADREALSGSSVTNEQGRRGR
jgi:hypothetical protein